MALESAGKSEKQPEYKKSSSTEMATKSDNVISIFREERNKSRGHTVILPTKQIKEVKILKAKECDDFFKIIVVGPKFAGKTSLIRQFCYQEFDQDDDEVGSPTFGMQNHVKKVPFDDLKLHVSFWDTPSDERFLPQVSFHISTSDAVLFVYDGCNATSLTELKKLLEELSVPLNASEAVLYLIATKKDKREKGAAEYIIPNSIIQKHKLKYASTSSKIPEMVQELFQQILEALVAKRNEEEEGASNGVESLVNSVAGDSREEARKRRASRINAGNRQLLLWKTAEQSSDVPEDDDGPKWPQNKSVLDSGGKIAVTKKKPVAKNTSFYSNDESKVYQRPTPISIQGLEPYKYSSKVDNNESEDRTAGSWVSKINMNGQEDADIVSFRTTRTQFQSSQKNQSCCTQDCKIF